ncbi:hypothetical protein C1I57_39930, partial [Escherichia coli]
QGTMWHLSIFSVISFRYGFSDRIPQQTLIGNFYLLVSAFENDILNQKLRKFFYFLCFPKMFWFLGTVALALAIKLQFFEMRI